MNKGRSVLGIVSVVVALIFATPLFAQMGGEMGGMAGTVQAPMNSLTAGPIAISGFWARMAAQVGGVSAAYMEIRSAAEEDSLTRAESPVAKVVELHETTMSDGVMAMSPVRSMTVPAKGEPLVLKPAGLHVMLIDLVTPLKPGDVIDLDLYFEKAGKVALKVPVLAP